MDVELHPPVEVSSVIPESYMKNYDNKLIVLNPTALKEEFRHEEFQYFYAKAGFGCDPSKLGTKIFGEFLYDGEKASFRRADFLGIADQDKLPEWAKEKLQQLTTQKNDGPTYTGMSM